MNGMCVCVFIYVCIYTHIRVYVCKYICIFMCVCVYIHMCIYMRVYICVCIYTHVYMCVSIYIYIYVCVYIYMYMRVCVYICVYIHTHIYVCVYILNMFLCDISRRRKRPRRSLKSSWRRLRPTRRAAWKRLSAGGSWTRLKVSGRDATTLKLALWCSARLHRKSLPLCLHGMSGLGLQQRIDNNRLLKSWQRISLSIRRVMRLSRH